jgi:6-phosphogluconolactonase/glucosamine-6-phosphate isomerase/deaminase
MSDKDSAPAALTAAAIDESISGIAKEVAEFILDVTFESNSLNSGELMVTERNSPKPPPERISMSYTLINNSANVIFLITGADKAHTLRQVLRNEGDPKRIPAMRVNPTNGTLIWLIDKDAASELE